jgi:lipoyl(octanoyl) transferase
MRTRDLGLTAYAATFEAMRSFTDARTDATPDEIWITEHAPVFTQGQAGRPEHVLAPGDIPVVQSDRGGQVTYHGPGQLVVYPLLDIRRLALSPRRLVTALECAMIALLVDYGIAACARPDAPGVYAGGDKIGSLGLRIRRGRAYHGLSLNVNMDLEPFTRINPCGLSNQRVTQLGAFVPGITVEMVKAPLVDHLLAALKTGSGTCLARA